MSLLILTPLLLALASIGERPRRYPVYRKRVNRFEVIKTAR